MERGTKTRAPKTKLQEIFLKRVREEMDKQRLNVTALSKRVGAPAQTTLNDIMRGADPRLESVHAIATALGVEAVYLLTEIYSRQNVHKFPSYPQISVPQDKHEGKKAGETKRKRA